MERSENLREDLVSVVIPAFNASKYIREAVESALSSVEGEC